MLDQILPFLEAWIVMGLIALGLILLCSLTTRGRIWFYRRYRYDHEGRVLQHQREMAREGRRWQREQAKTQAKAARQ